MFALALNTWASTVSEQLLLATMLFSGTAWLILHRGHWLRQKLGAMWATVIVFLVCGAIGAFGFWAFTSATDPDAAVPSATARTEFLLESAKPLKQLALWVDLKREMTASELGHFRILLSIIDSSARIAGAKDPSNPHPTLLFGGRDAYPTVTASGMTTKRLGVRYLVSTLNPEQKIQSTDFSTFEESTRRIEIRGAVAGQGILRSISDIDGCSVWVYATEPLVQHVSAIHLVANSYVLFSYRADQLGAIGARIGNQWLDELSTDDANVPWTGLLPKGPDHDAFMKERARLGHDPEWFPARMWASWIPSFESYTPARIE